MAVDVQGRAGVCMAQPLRDGDNIGSAVDQDAGSAVPEAVRMDVRETMALRELPQP